MVVVWRDYITLYEMEHKSEASLCAKRLIPTSSNSRDGHPGGSHRREFVGSDFRKIVAAEGLRHEHATRYHSSQNGVAERPIRTLTEMAAVESKMPHYLWEFA
ncbi:hypothetical protein PR001_g14731 [Phytophthora rubi]|uniref:Integrase catalytic domain-containing protein n=1 Tax=Phytophthora rubi TaxID=129364 RepID=A0A6A3LCP6_9STRA|nr:hypothetical protein PR002_g15243 [Phytophthora rubi]KAE9016135.1 hypothetical protein PR001_g14731 [Phytophthora rubi]